MHIKHYGLLLVSTFAMAQDPVTDSLQEVKVETSRKSLKRALTVTANTTVMSSRELLKAACCNLAESFETNPAIDVNFQDALTGVRQIRMLGLASPYLAVTEENIPFARGASQAYGLSFTPGTWVHSIQVTKGAGSVINGFESISGQVNTELIKPMDDIPFFANVYSSSDGRFELNTHFNRRLSPKWSSSLLVHGNARPFKTDMNDDGFLDNPLTRQANIASRWQYQDPETGWEGFASIRYLDDNKVTGETGFDPDRHRGTTHHWGSEIRTRRLDLSTKTGYVFLDMPYQSIGWQNAFSVHDQNSYFGQNLYNLTQRSFYSNLIFSSIINNTRHKFTTGLSFTYDHYDEYVVVPQIDENFDRIDNSFGAFFEYNFNNDDNFSLIAGLRADVHNRLGAFLTPRLHLRYVPWEKGVLRASAGRGRRAANIFAENQQLFASARTFDVRGNGGKLYGLNPEVAWNYGLSFQQRFSLFGKPSEIGFDFYRTDFDNQVVVDMYGSPQSVSFYDLDGRSDATSLQVDFESEPIRRLNVRLAYKTYQVRTDFLSSGYRQKPLQPQQRLFGNIAYETPDRDGRRWKFDATYNGLGAQWLPYTGTNPEADRLPNRVEGYSLVHFQVTRVFSGAFEVYAGGENIGNYRQQKAILGADDPFGPTFDASISYAPVFGRMFYAGLRYKVPQKNK